MGRHETWMFARVPRHRRPRRSPPRRAPAAESLEEAVARGPCAVAAVLASHPEPGDPGSSGPLSAIGPWLLLDAAQSAADDGDPIVGFLGSFSQYRELSGVPVRGAGPLEFSQRKRERVCLVHHRERGVDPEDIRSQAGLPAGSNLDQPGDAALVDGLSVPASLAAGCDGPRCR